MRVFIFIIICLTLFECNSTSIKNIESKDSTISKKEVLGQKFFEYDEIEYYNLQSIKSPIDSINKIKKKSELDAFEKEIIFGNIPKNISDLTFINKLPKIGYKKTSIDKSKFEKIDNIFIEKTVSESYSSECIHVYRDILIFKKDKKVIGTAKICFSCLANQINGTKAKTENFGQNGDYQKLEELLKK